LIYKSNTTDKGSKTIKSFFPLPSDISDEDESPKLTSDQLMRTLKMYGVK
jgi:hypothetical protein